MFAAPAVVALLLTASMTVDRQQPRDARPPVASAAGTATIAGVVVTDDAQSRPLRRARVTLNGSPLQIGRTAITADDGTFMFDRLPAGRYTLGATKDGYVTMSYGARRPARPGTPLELKNAEARTITIRIPRGGVITGTVTNAEGLPAAGVAVNALTFRYVAATGERRLLPAGLATGPTDDRGVYRIFGLPAGEYVIGAQMRQAFGAVADLVTLSDAEIRRALADVRTAGSSSQPGRSTAPAPQPTVTAEVRRNVSPSPIYYPGTTVAANARTVTVAAADERGGIDFQLQYAPTTTVEGTLFSASAAGERAAISLVTSGQGVVVENNRGAMAGADGRFTFRGVTPGQYSVLARTISAPPRPGAAAPTGSAVSWASAEIVVDGQDVIDVPLTYQPGLTISGRVAFEGANPPPALIPGLRFGVPLMLSTSSALPPLPPVQMEGSGRFTISGIIPGPYRFGSVQGQHSPIGGWWLKSVMVNGSDVLDTPLDLRRSADDAVVTFADDATELTGRVTDSTGNPASNHVVIVFAVDSASWFFNSRRIVGIRPDAEGRYVIRNLPRGEYFVLAFDDVEQGEWYDPSLLQRLTGESKRISLGDVEKKSLDIVVAGR